MKFTTENDTIWYAKSHLNAINLLIIRLLNETVCQLQRLYAWKIWKNAVLAYLKILRWRALERETMKDIKIDGNPLGFKQGTSTVKVVTVN
jgi:hypothetical protein